MEPIQLATADIRPIIPAAVRERVLGTLVQCVAAYSPIRVDCARLKANLDRNFDRLCDGISVDLEPLATKWLSTGRMSAPEIHLIASRLALELRAIGIAVRSPALELPEELKLRLDREVREAHAGPLMSAPKRVRIGDLLVQYGLITDEQLQRALLAQKARGGRIGTVLIDEGFIDSATLGHFLSVQLGIEATSSEQLAEIPESHAALIPRQLALRHRAVALSTDARVLTVAMIDPTDLSAIQDLAFATGHQIVVRVAPEACLGSALERLYGENPVHQGFGAIEFIGDDRDAGCFVRSDDRWRVLDPSSW